MSEADDDRDEMRQNGGGVGRGSVVSTAAITDQPAGLEPETPRVREARSVAANRWIREGLAAEVEKFRDRIRAEGRDRGMRRAEAANEAWEQALDAYPPSGIEAVEPPRPEPEPEPDLPDSEPDSLPDPPPETGVTGLGEIPDDWPDLPANASLSAEIQWVQSSRLDVVEEVSDRLTRVHLDRADQPAPSKAAIGWLETSIRAYSKYCDIAAKATSQQADDAEHVQRERIAIADIRSLLAEMVDDGA